MRKRWIIGVAAGLFVVAAVVIALVFKPWLLFVDVTVNETLPTLVQTPSPSASASVSAAPEATESVPTVPVQLSAGELISHEHETSGTVRIIENPDGSRVLTLENFETSNGPDVRVWLSSVSIVADANGGFPVADSPYVDLGLIKGNLGNQVYQIPADVDLGQYSTVFLWCAQFSVSFGAAELA